MLSVPKAIWPYIDKAPTTYSQEAIDAFHAITGRGSSMALACIGLTAEQALELKDLFDGQSSLRVPSGIVEGLWADGQTDYPIRVMLRDMIIQGIRDNETWHRRLPLYERAYRFSLYIHDTACRYTLAVGGQHSYMVKQSYPPNVRVARCSKCGWRQRYAV